MLSPCNFNCQADDGPVKPATVANHTILPWGTGFYLLCADCANRDRVIDYKYPQRFEPLVIIEPGSEMHIALDHAFMTLAGVL